MKRILALILGLSLYTYTSVSFTQSKNAEYLIALEAFHVDDMRAALSKATDHGLNYKDYWTDGMEQQYLQEGAGTVSMKEQIKASYLRLLQHLSTGTINPGNLGKDIEVSKKRFVDAQQFGVMLLVSGGSAQTFLENFASQNPPYRGLQAALSRISQICAENQWLPVPALKRELKLGSQDAILPAVKARLRQLGYAVASMDDIYDQTTFNAVNDIQSTLHYKPDGVISPNGRTWKYLNVSCENRLQQIRLDLEKLRWFPRDFGDRYIYVNLAMTYLNLVDKETGTSQVMKTINGRVERKSPTLIDKIVYVVVNPFWIVPPTVFREDKLTAVRGLAPWDVQNYFYQNHYQVWDEKFTRQYDPSYINWNLVTNDTPLYIRQLPGRHNALGVLKFMMTNDLAIYLHDTNQRELFAESKRQLSSGCVRVERPYDLAEHLLLGTKWDRQMIEAKTAQPGQVLNTDTKVSLVKSMPVYMVFQTSLLSSDGVLRFAEDTYGQGERMLRARR